MGDHILCPRASPSPKAPSPGVASNHLTEVKQTHGWTIYCTVQNPIWVFPHDSKHHFRIFLLRVYYYTILQCAILGNRWYFGPPWAPNHAARRISFRFFCTTSTRGKPPSSKRSGIRAPSHGSKTILRRGVPIGFIVYHKKCPNMSKLDGSSWFIIISPWKNTFLFNSFGVCPILRQTLTIGRFLVPCRYLVERGAPPNATLGNPECKLDGADRKILGIKGLLPPNIGSSRQNYLLNSRMVKRTRELRSWPTYLGAFDSQKDLYK